MRDEPIKLPGFKCLRCKHEWAPRKPVVPRKCPGCGSAYYDREPSQ